MGGVCRSVWGPPPENFLNFFSPLLFGGYLLMNPIQCNKFDVKISLPFYEHGDFANIYTQKGLSLGGEQKL